MTSFARRQNTDFWWDRFGSLMSTGEELEDEPLESFKTVDDLRAYKNRVDEWVKEIARQIHLVFEEQSLVDEYAFPSADIDFEGESRLNIIKKIKEMVSDRVGRLATLMSNTAESEGRV